MAYRRAFPGIQRAVRAAVASGGGGNGTHDVTGFPLDASGFHDLQAIVNADSAYASARFLYVDPTLGNNATAGPSGNGTDYYTRSSFTNPFAPTGTVNAYSTVASANAQRRANTCDVILFKRGETFSSLPSFDISGSSTTARAIIAAYGTSGARPNFPAVFQSMSGVQYLIVADLDINANGSTAEAGINLTVTGGPGVRHVLFENNYISEWSRGMVAQNTSGTASNLENCVLYRNIFDRNQESAPGENSIGIFCYWFDLATLDQNIWLENGWDGVNAAEKDPQSRHVYVDDCRLMLFRENVCIRPSSEQIQYRNNAGASGRQDQGTIHNNLFLDAGLHVLLSWNDGAVQMTMTDNVLQGTLTDTPIGYAGVGVMVEHATNTRIHRNIFTQSDVVGGGSGLFPISIWLAQGTIDDVDITDNYINEWGVVDLIGFPATVSNVTMSGNRVSIAAGNNFLEHNVTGSGITGNSFYGGDAAPFRSNGTDRALAAWQSASGASSNTHSSTALGSPLTIESYLTAQSLGSTLSDYMTSLRAQDRNNWNNALSAAVVNNWFRAQVGGF